MKRIGQEYREKIISELKDALNSNQSVFVVNYSHLKGGKLNDFRKNLKKIGAQTYVSKNTLAAIALKELGHEKLAERLSGQTAFVWSNDDALAISKLLVSFSKDFAKLTVQGGVLEGKQLSANDVKAFSELPPRKVLLAQLLGTIQAPVTRLLYIFNAKSQDLLSILKQLSEKKGGS